MQLLMKICLPYIKFHSTDNTSTEHCFPHSDELTQSFAPVLSDCVSEHAEETTTLTQGWGKLDTLDVDEMLQLLETTPETWYRSGRNSYTVVANSKVCGKPKTNNEALVESVQPANHIFTEDFDPRYELHSSSGKTANSGKSGKTIGKLTRYHNPTTDCSNESEKSENSNSEGEVVQCKDEPDRGRVLRSCAKQPTSRICKRRSRKKQIKKTSHSKKKDNQRITA